MNKLDWFYSLIDRASAPAKRIADAFARIDANAKKADGARRFFDRLQKRAEVAASSVRKSMGAVQTAFAGVGAVGLTATALGIGGAGMLGKSILDAAGLKEQTLVSFGVMLKPQGLEKDAEKIYKQVEKFAAVTPFETTEVIAASKQILAAQVPVKKLNNYLKIGGDLASGMGVSLDDALSPILRLRAGNFGEAFERLRELGISRAELEGKGLKFDKGGSYKGSVQAALDAVSAIVTRKFGGMMDKQSTTIFGLVSTLQSRPFELFSTLNTGKGGQLEGVKTFMSNLAAATDFTKPPGSTISKTFQDSVGGIFKEVFGTLADASNPKAIEQITKTISGVIAGGARFIVDAIKFARAAAPTVREIIATVTKFAQAAAPIIADIAPVVVRTVQTVADALSMLRPYIPAILAFGAAIFVALKVVTAISAISGIIATVTAAGGVFAALAPIIGGAFALIGGWIPLVIAAVIGLVVLIVTNWGKIAPAVSAVWETVKSVFFSALNAVWGAVSGVFTAVVGFIVTTWNSIPAFFSGLWLGIRGIFQGAIDFFAQFPFTPLGAVAWLIQNWQLIPAMFAQVWANVTATFNGFLAFITGIPARMLELGANIVQGLANGIMGAIGAVGSAVKSVADNAIGGLKGLLGIASPSRVFMTLGAFTGEGAALGISSQAKAVRNAAAGLGLAASAAFSPALAVAPLSAPAGVGQSSSIPMPAPRASSAVVAPKAASGKTLSVTIQNITIQSAPTATPQEFKQSIKDALLEALEELELEGV